MTNPLSCHDILTGLRRDTPACRGHHNLATTHAYLAVFQAELIQSYRAYLDTRRADRPAAEYREPTEDEWTEFQKHFELRKVELGTCGRPYGTQCAHEHA